MTSLPTQLAARTGPARLETHADAVSGPLPDYLRTGLDVVFVGSNPGIISARRGHYYANRGNHFWGLLADAGFVPDGFGCDEDGQVNDHGIGLTDLVRRASHGVADLSREETAAGALALTEKLSRVRPRVVCFNGKAVYEAFIGRRCAFGLQAERVEGAVAFAMPSTSRRAASYGIEKKQRYFRELRGIVEREAGRGG